jgi:hypothetical protein
MHGTSRPPAAHRERRDRQNQNSRQLQREVPSLSRELATSRNSGLSHGQVLDGNPGTILQGLVASVQLRGGSPRLNGPRVVAALVCDVAEYQ